MTKFLNIDLNTDLNGSNASDELVSSQKAIKTYVDSGLAKKQNTVIGGKYIDFIQSYDLPSNYTQLQYLSNVANSSRVDLGIQPQDGDEIEATFYVNSSSKVSFYFIQARATSTSNVYGISGAQSNNGLAASFSGTSIQSSIIRKNEHKYYVKASFIDGTMTLLTRDYTAGSRDTVTTSYTYSAVSSNYYLWGNSSQKLNAVCPIQEMKITNNGVVRIHLIPVTTGSTDGLYNLVDGTYTAIKNTEEETEALKMDKAIINVGDALSPSNFVAANTSITGATKCKITYDSKGLVTAGADLQASDIPDLSSTYQTVLPSQTSQSGKFLTTDGSTLSWGKVTSVEAYTANEVQTIWDSVTPSS